MLTLISGRGTQSNMVRKQNQDALNTFLVAADALVRGKQIIEAEIRYLDALRVAEKTFGKESDQAMLVLTILSSFYRSQERELDALAIEGRLASWEMKPVVIEEPETKVSMIAGNTAEKSGQSGVRPSLTLRKECQILGISMDEYLTPASINRAWKKQMLANGAHPDLGGNTDEAVLLNKAKEALLNHLNERAPKLGNVFKRTVS